MILWAEQAGVLKIKEDRVEYMLAKVKSYRLTDPEERVRAEFCVELVGRYGYPKERIDLEVEVPRREPKDKADIVVYEDDKLKAPYVVAECKRDGIAPNDIKQAVEQVFGNAHSLGAKYAIVVAGSVRLAFDVAGFPSMERERNIVADIPIKYGKVVKFKYKRSDDEWDLREVDRNEILAKFQQCHDTLWEAGKRNPAEAFDEMSKLMFCKIHDERFLTKKGEHYRFQIGTHEEIKDVAERVKKIYQDAQKVDPDVFLDPIKAEDPIIYGVVEVLQRISLSKTDLDAKGVAFEHFLGSVFRGEMGQYFTPRPIVEFMVDVLHPDENDFVIDPACGSGGFLLYTLDKVKRHLEYSLSPRDADYRWRNFGLKQLFGIEINSQLARVAMINMIIHEDGHSNIESNDSLDNPQRFNPRRDMRLGKYTLLLTNPPFGAVTIQREKPYLSEYELGGKRKKRKRQNTEILFIERCLDFLAPMGRIGIVLPDGILTNASLQYVRDFVLDSGQILAVVSLPHTTFVHYGSGVKSSLVFIRKKIDGEVLSSDYHIFMAIAEHVGYDATGRPTDNDLPSILKSWKDFDENRRIGLISDRPLCFSVRRDELENALNPARYSVTPPEQVNWAALISYGQVIYDTIQPRKYPQKIFDVIRIDDLENNCHEAVNLRTLYGESLKGIYQNVLPNDVLITRLGPGILNKKSLVCSFTANEAIASTEFIVFRPRQGVNPWGILAILKTDYFKELMYSKCRGATPSRFRLVRDDFEALQFPSMKEATIDSIGRRFLQNRERAKFLRIEAQKLVTDIHDDVQKTLLKGK
jgi:type I restriction enzyme M protein